MPTSSNPAMPSPPDPVATGQEIAQRALTRKRFALSRLVSLAEDTRAAMVPVRDAALAELESAAAARRHRGWILGVTGTPGAGKSSLLSRLAGALTTLDPRLTLAIVAVDPSSPLSKGALLGDRTRMSLAGADDRVYFRSQASATALGGLAPSTYHVCHALALVFDIVIVETVGVGQSEADIRHLADRVYLVIAPLGGDEIQYLKAGIVEVPDAFVINKWDEPSAARTYHQLRGSLWLARPGSSIELPIHKVSARTGYGVDELAHALLADAASLAEAASATAAYPTGAESPSGAGAPAKMAHFFRAWVIEEWGRVGASHLLALGGAEVFLAGQTGFSAAQLAFDASLRAALSAS